jgi:hypothetical protein
MIFFMYFVSLFIIHNNYALTLFQLFLFLTSFLSARNKLIIKKMKKQRQWYGYKYQLFFPYTNYWNKNKIFPTLSESGTKIKYSPHYQHLAEKIKYSPHYQNVAEKNKIFLTLSECGRKIRYSPHYQNVAQK